MESLIVGILVMVVVWLVAKQNGRTGERERLDELESAVSRLDARLGTLEKTARTAVSAPPPQQPAAAVAPPTSAALRPAALPPQPVALPTPVAPPVAPAPPPAARPAAAPIANHAAVTRAEAALINRYPLNDAAVAKATTAPTPADSATPQPMPAAATPPPPASAKLPPPLPRIELTEMPQPRRSISLEERLGRNWLNKLGIVALVIGLSSLLGLKVLTMGPLGKSMIGLLLSLALLGGGLLLERRSKYRIFARAMIGGGWAMTFFVTFALYHVDAMRVLPNQGIDLVLMLGVAAAMVGHSLHYKSQVVTSLAFLLAFVTVGISEVTLFSLVAGVVLVAGLIFVAARERWFELGLAGLIGAYLNHFLWLRRVLPGGGQPGHPFPEFFASAGLLILYWLIFRLFYVLRVPENRRQEAVSSFTAILNSAGLLSLLKYQSAHPEWAFWALLALGTAELVLAFIARRRWHIAFVVLSSIASVLLLAAIPFRFGGTNWSLMWLLQAEVLFIAGVRMPEKVFRRLGAIAGFAAFGQILGVGIAPIFELRQAQMDASSHWPIAIALLVAAAMFWFNAEFATRRWEFVVADELDRNGMRATSYLALLGAGFGLWVCVPAAWTIVAWLAVALALGWFSDRLGSRDLATQSDLLALTAVVRSIAINLFVTQHWGWLTLRAVTVAPAVALLYAAMRRKTRAHWLDEAYVVEVYSWLACGLLAALLWFELPAAGIAVGWAIFSLTLAWAGDWRKSKNFATQADALALCAAVRAAAFNLSVATRWHGLSIRAITVGTVCIVLYLAMRRNTRAYTVEANYVPPVYSWAAAGLLAALLWCELPVAGVAVAWAGFALILSWLADWRKSKDFATQADALSLCAVIRVASFNLFVTTRWHGLSVRGITVGIVCAVLYLAMRRTTRAYMVEADYIPPVYSWAACGLLATLAWDQLQPIGVAVAWGVFGLALFELGLAFRRGYFRQQGYALLVASFVRIFFANLDVAESGGWLSPRVYTVVPLLAAYFWVYERLRTEHSESSFDRGASIAAAWAGTIAASALAYCEVRGEWVALAWASLAFLAILTGWFLKRPLFVGQALALLLASAGRVLMFNLLSPEPLATTFLNSRAFAVGAACGWMLLALPMAFGIRKQRAAEAESAGDDWSKLIFFRPEQPFFFVPLILATLLLAMDLRAGMITVGWSALGVLAFLLALAVGERSYRLAGLSLLLLGAGKVVCVDIWKASPSDRYITLIVMGAAMLLVSFLYSRYRETILKFL